MCSSCFTLCLTYELCFVWFMYDGMVAAGAIAEKWLREAYGVDIVGVGEQRV